MSGLNLELLFREKEQFHFNASLPAPLCFKKTIFTMYARNALYKMGKSLAKNEKRKVVLVPAYSCGDEIASLVGAGLEIRPYEITDNFQVNLSDLFSRKDKETLAIMVTHFLSIPSVNIFEIKEFARKNKIFLIENCAHVFDAKLKNVHLGEIGDFSVFSIRKFLPLPHGGALVINNPSLEKPTFTLPPNEAVMFDFLVYLERQLNIFSLGTTIDKIYKNFGIKIRNKHGQRLEKWGGYELSLSNFSKNLIMRMEIKEIMKKRREVFSFYNRFFQTVNSKRFTPLAPLIPDEVNPIFYPLRIKNATAFYKNLKRRGLMAGNPFWDDLHQYINWEDFPISHQLKNEIFVLPLDRQVNNDMLKLAFS